MDDTYHICLTIWFGFGKRNLLMTNKTNTYCWIPAVHMANKKIHSRVFKTLPSILIVYLIQMFDPNVSLLYNIIVFIHWLTIFDSSSMDFFLVGILIQCFIRIKADCGFHTHVFHPLSLTVGPAAPLSGHKRHKE